MKKRLINFAIFLSIIVASFFAILQLNIMPSLTVAPNVNFYQPADNLPTKFVQDNTSFEFKYGNKIWEFEAMDFVETSAQFDIDFKLNKYKLNNNKNEKIKLIKNLKKLKINNKLIINSVFPKMQKKIENISKNIEKQPKNAYFQYNGKLKIINEIYGININFDLFFEKILNNYLNFDNVKINIPVIKTSPEITSEDLKLTSSLRGQFSTSYTKSTLDRKHNIKMALSKINGTKIGAGEQFSFNKTVGRRTKENGFRMAKIISNGEYVDGFGGGVCQVSTTLYNSALLSGLKIDRANKHSEKVGYVMTGFDAMVNFGSSDLVFTNNTGADIYIFADYSSASMTIKIFGKKNDYTVKLRNEIVDKKPAGECQEIVDVDKKYIDRVEFADESFYLKTAHDGYTVKSFRDFYRDGVLVESQLLRTDKYPPQNAIRVFGAQVRDDVL